MDKKQDESTRYFRKLLEAVSDKAASLGLLTRAPEDVPNPKAANVAGLTVRPCPIPRAAFQLAHANEPIWHRLYNNIVSEFSEDIPKLLEDVQEDFIAKLLELRQEVKKEEYPQIGRLQFYRNDYMIDGQKGLKQIELNTIGVEVRTTGHFLRVFQKRFQNRLTI